MSTIPLAPATTIEELTGDLQRQRFFNSTDFIQTLLLAKCLWTSHLKFRALALGKENINVLKISQPRLDYTTWCLSLDFLFLLCFSRSTFSLSTIATSSLSIRSVRTGHPNKEWLVIKACLPQLLMKCGAWDSCACVVSSLANEFYCTCCRYIRWHWYLLKLLDLQ